MHQLVDQKTAEQRPDQAEPKAELKADQHGRDGGVAGLARRERRGGQAAMMA